MRIGSVLAVATLLGGGAGLGLLAPEAIRDATAARVPHDVTLPAVSALAPNRPLARKQPAPRRVLSSEAGSASYYANSLAGRRTASGLRYDPAALVAAHRTLPFGSLLRVTNRANGRSVEVSVVDRGPFVRGRILDLSRSAAERLDFIRRGHTEVTLEVLRYGESEARGP